MTTRTCCDFDFSARLDLLADLMLKSPNKLVRKLQWESLKYYPVQSRELVRMWMTQRIAFKAAEKANVKAGISV